MTTPSGDNQQNAAVNQGGHGAIRAIGDGSILAKEAPQGSTESEFYARIRQGVYRHLTAGNSAGRTATAQGSSQSPANWTQVKGKYKNKFLEDMGNLIEDAKAVRTETPNPCARRTGCGHARKTRASAAALSNRTQPASVTTFHGHSSTRQEEMP